MNTIRLSFSFFLHFYSPNQVFNDVVHCRKAFLLECYLPLKVICPNIDCISVFLISLDRSFHRVMRNPKRTSPEVWKPWLDQGICRFWIAFSTFFLFLFDLFLSFLDSLAWSVRPLVESTWSFPRPKRSKIESKRSSTTTFPISVLRRCRCPSSWEETSGRPPDDGRILERRCSKWRYFMITSSHRSRTERIVSIAWVPPTRRSSPNWFRTVYLSLECVWQSSAWAINPCLSYYIRMDWSSVMSSDLAAVWCALESSTWMTCIPPLSRTIL